MPLPLIFIAKVVVTVAARVAVRAIASAAPKVIAQAAKQAPKIIKETVKQAPKVIEKTVKQASKAGKKAGKKAGRPTKENTTPAKIHKGKAKKKKDDCEKALKKYPVHKYDDKAQHCTPGVHQSHHVIQNAQFMVGGKPIKDICPGYSSKNAPCIPLKGNMIDPESPHGIVTDMQKKDAAKARLAQKAPTYRQAKDNAKKQLKAARIPANAIKCIMNKVEEMIKEMCPGLTDSTPLRIPQR
jgi:hypothetical protein